TAVIQSSSASVGILQSLAAAGLVPFSAAVYIIMGQNIGTCVTAMMSGIGAKKNARTAAWMHLLFNIIGTVLFSVAAIVYFQFLNPAMGREAISQTQISMVHTVFNILTTVILFPASDRIIRLAKKLQREDEEKPDEGHVLLDERMLQTPSIALSSIESEVGRMGEIVKRTMGKAEEVMFSQDGRAIQEIREEENVADSLCHEITDYLIRISSLSINEKEHQHVAALLQIVSDMERVSDYCENISEYAENLKENNVKFTDVGKARLQQMIRVCADSFSYAVEAVEGNDREAAGKVLREEEKADELEIALRTEHMRRLAANECTAEAGIVFLDALVGLERISDHSRNIAEEILGAWQPVV
ncbi:MAG: Na/Pi symporter, partial [Clostridiales bacterium]|nr:Na/Pi symporter [Clostridiales bacterium]